MATSTNDIRDSTSLNKTVLENKFAEFEKQIGYEFNNKAYIHQAFNYPSSVTKMYTSSHQK